MITENIVVLEYEIEAFEKAVNSFKEMKIINKNYLRNNFYYYTIEHDYASDLYCLGARVEILKQDNE